MNFTKKFEEIKEQIYIEGYPQRMRLQRRLYGICFIRFLAFRFPCRPNLAYFCALSFIKPLKYSIEYRNQKSRYKSTYF